MRVPIRYPIVVAAMLTVLAGCVRQRSSTGSSSSSSATRSDSSRTRQSDSYTDAQIAALFDEANKADSSTSFYAAGKTNNSDVKYFARMMVRDHHTLRQRLSDWAKQKNITPEPPPDDTLQQAADSAREKLRVIPPGAGLDRVYIEQEVATHRAVIALVQRLRSAAQDQRLQRLLDGATSILRQHLDSAEAIAGRLSGGKAS